MKSAKALETAGCPAVRFLSPALEHGPAQCRTGSAEEPRCFGCRLSGSLCQSKPPVSHDAGSGVTNDNQLIHWPVRLVPVSLALSLARDSNDTGIRLVCSSRRMRRASFSRSIWTEAGQFIDRGIRARPGARWRRSTSLARSRLSASLTGRYCTWKSFARIGPLYRQ